MMFNKKFKKPLFTGLAAIALFAPVAFGGGQNAHAQSFDDVFNQQSSQQANDAARAQGAEYEKQQGAYYASHKDEIDKSMGSSSADNGTQDAKNNAAQAKDNHDSSSNNQTSTNPDTGADTSSKPNYDYSNSDNNNSNNNNSSNNDNPGKNFKEYKDDKSGNVKYPNAPKSQQKTNQKATNKKVAKELNSYSKHINKKSARNDLKKITKSTDKLHYRKNQKSLKEVAKYVHGAKNRTNFNKAIKQL